MSYSFSDFNFISECDGCGSYDLLAIMDDGEMLCQCCADKRDEQKTNGNKDVHS